MVANNMVFGLAILFSSFPLPFSKVMRLNLEEFVGENIEALALLVEVPSYG